jgi:hypothetical protein
MHLLLLFIPLAGPKLGGDPELKLYAISTNFMARKAANCKPWPGLAGAIG